MNRTIIFFLILVAEIIADECGYRMGVWILKPLLMPLLMTMIGNGAVQEGKLLMAALFFSLLGDIILMFEGYFVFGLAAFLMAHLIYIRLFLKAAVWNTNKAIPFLVLAVCFYTYIFSDIPQTMRIPVAMYCAIISTMAAITSMRNMEQKGNPQILLGAVIFMVSDSSIAYDRFVANIPYSSLLIMLTYGIAQYLIVRGLINNAEA